jgi:serine/threonine protein phosphatase PrpC
VGHHDAAPDDPRGFPAASASDVGRVRSENQDSYVDALHPSEPLRLWLTADGMGGHRGGSVASSLAVESATQAFERQSGASAEAARELLRAANARIHQVSSQREEVAGMGSTGVGLLVGAGLRGFSMNVGDSRLYRLRAGRLELLTEDHSLVGELVRAGEIDEAEARVHPRRNQLRRALGIRPEEEIDVRELQVEPGDRYLLCSDGLWGALDHEEVASLLGGFAPEEAARRLIERANAEDGSDNVTVQIAVIPEDAPRARGRRAGGGMSRTNWLLVGVAALLASLLAALLR